MSHSLYLSLLVSGCLIDHAQYQQRRDVLTDDDQDGFSEYDGDCSDVNPYVFPGAEELCNEDDDDCDGFIDNDPVDGGPWYFDEDGDGYGATDSSVLLCESPGAGWLLEGGDCEDADPEISPAAVEVCNGIDDDCSGEIDDDAADGAVWYEDADADGYGDESAPNKTCEDTTGLLLEGGDCDDTDPDVNPEGQEVCNDRLDNDCDGTVNHCTWPESVELSDQLQIAGVYGNDSVGYAGTAADLDGDGVSELILSAYAAYRPEYDALAGMVLVFEPTIVESMDRDQADFAISGHPESSGGFGTGVAAADLDQDGYIDLLAGAHGSDRNGIAGAGAGFVFYGPITGDVEAEEADWILEGAADNGRFARRTHLVGDLDGDGAEDFGMSHEWWDYDDVNSSGTLWIFTDASTGLSAADDAAHAIVYDTEEDASLGRSFTGLDFNGDGRDDLVVGSEDSNDYDGQVYLYEDVSGLLSDADADVAWTGEEGGNAGRKLDNLGDTNNDGYGDILVGAPDTDFYDGAAYILWGSAEPVDAGLADADVTIRGSREGIKLGFTVHNVGDLNDDDADEIAIGKAGNPPCDAYVFFGPFDTRMITDDSEADIVLYGGDDDEDYELILGPGDITGDAVPDLLLGSYLKETPFGDNYAGTAYIIPGIGL